MNILFKILSFLFTVLFLVSAALQYNDPDPIIWIVTWGTAAILSILFFFNKISFPVPLIVGIACFVGGVYLFPSNFQGFGLGDGDIENIELAREAVGLLIIALVLWMYAFRIRYVQRKLKNQSPVI